MFSVKIRFLANEQFSCTNKIPPPDHVTQSFKQKIHQHLLFQIHTVTSEKRQFIYPSETYLLSCGNFFNRWFLDYLSSINFCLVLLSPYKYKSFFFLSSWLSGYNIDLDGEQVVKGMPVGIPTLHNKQFALSFTVISPLPPCW